jgi:uncharacterized membrane protein YfcA
VTLTALALLALVYLFCGFVFGTIGFGAGMIGVSLGVLLIPMEQAVVVSGLAVFWLTLGMLWSLRDAVVWRDALPVVGGAAIGAPVGIALLRGGDPALLHGLLGGGIAAALAVELGIGRRLPPAGAVSGVVAGAVGGLLGGAVSAGGPPVVVWIEATRRERRRRVASLQAYFVAASLLQMGLWARSDLLGWDELALGAGMIPVLLSGLWLGRRVFDRLDEAEFRRLVMAGLAVMAVKNLWAARALLG